MSFGLFIMLAAILHALWRQADPKGTAEWDETVSWIGACVILIILAGGIVVFGAAFLSVLAEHSHDHWVQPSSKRQTSQQPINPADHEWHQTRSGIWYRFEPDNPAPRR